MSAGSLPALVAFMLVGLHARQSYSPGDARRDSYRLATGLLLGLALVVVAQQPSGTEGWASFLAVFGLASLALLVVGRRTVDAAVHALYVRGVGLRRALIVTRAHELPGLMAELTPHAGDRPAEDQVIVGYVTPDAASGSALGSLDNIVPVMGAHEVSELLLATDLPEDVVAEVAEIAFERGVQVLVTPAVGHAGVGWTDLTRIGRLPAYQLHPTRLELPQLALKRGTDLLLAGGGMLFVAPLILLLGLMIKLDSRGPVFFRQRRVGLGGREFMIWKFRSMRVDAEASHTEVAHLNSYSDGRLFKLRGDPRITRMGAFLRRWSLDELPQLFNVIAGDMSLVGPRPPVPAEVRRYEPRHMVRLSVVPGMTGPWQVSGRNLITDFEEVVRLERHYIETWSLRSDITIMLKTVAVVLSGQGAY